MRETVFTLVTVLSFSLFLAGCATSQPAAKPSIAAGSSGELVLVKDGVSLAPIVIFENAPPLTRQAADELATYIEKTSGAKPAIIEGTPDSIPERAIWVGYQPVLKTLFPNVDFEFKHPEEILLAANDKHVVIAGRDQWDPDHLVVEGRKRTINGYQKEYGTANAVYTFIQDVLGVRWLWPGDLGEEVAKRSTLAVDPFVYRHHPEMRHRSGAFYMSAIDGAPSRGISGDWCRRQRLQLDSMNIHPASHGFRDWWERFHETHPEYFALQPDGARGLITSPKCVKICQSNPEVWEQWINDVKRQLKDNPNLVTFDAGPNDSWTTGHCVCDRCRAWDHPDGEPGMFIWRGLSQEYVALSDRDVTFYNQLGRLLKERFPGADLYVRGSAYGHTCPAPIEAVPADNVLVTSVANYLLWPDRVARGSRIGTTYRQQFDDWAKVAPTLGWRPNISGGVRNGFPDVKLKHVADEFRHLDEVDCKTLTIDTFPEFWATQGPMYYLTGQLAWDPKRDAKAVMTDYYERGFGKAAAAMSEYWKLMENAADRYEIGTSYEDVYDESFFKEVYDLLDRAAADVAGEPKRFGDRVAFVRAGLDYARLYVKLAAVMKRYKKSGRQDKEAAAEARAIWAEIKRLGEKYPYGVRWDFINPKQRKIMRRYHPDYK